LKGGFGVTDEERLEFIKQRISYTFRKRLRQQGKGIEFMDDLIWLIDKAEKEIKRKKESRNGKQV